MTLWHFFKLLQKLDAEFVLVPEDMKQMENSKGGIWKSVAAKCLCHARILEYLKGIVAHSSVPFKFQRRRKLTSEDWVTSRTLRPNLLTIDRAYTKGVLIRWRRRNVSTFFQVFTRLSLSLHKLLPQFSWKCRIRDMPTSKRRISVSECSGETKNSGIVRNGE